MLLYTIQNIRHETSSIDNDFVDFKFDIVFTEPQQITVKDYHFGFGDLLRHIKLQKPELHGYVTQVAKSIERWGPHEPDTINAIGEEATEQLYDCLREYLMQCDWIEKLLEREMEMKQQTPRQKTEMVKKAEEVTHHLKGAFEGINQSKQKYYRFCENVERHARAVATEVYPEIADMTAEQLDTFRYLFVSEIQAMQKKLEAFVRNK